MTHRRITLGRTLFGFFTVFLQPFVVTGVFPYFQQVQVASQYYGQVIQESGFGGVLATNLILFIGFWNIKRLRTTKNKMLCAIACILLLFSGIIAFFDIQIGGLIPRYTVSFQWLLFLVASIALLEGTALIQGSRYWSIGYVIFMALFAQSMLFNILTIFTDVYEKVKDTSPVWFYGAEHLIEFWL